MSLYLITKLKSPSNWKKTFNSFGFFSLLMIVFQSIMMFQGIDLADTGAYMTFYQQFFNDPNSVYYFFMYWLSGLFGGLFLKIFPFAGLLGIRFLGTVLYGLTIFAVYRLLRSYVSEKSLKWSIFFVTLLMNNVPREFYYNNFSSFLYVLTVSALFIGITKEKKYLLYISGILISLNYFNRFPNILEVGLVSGIILWGILNKLSFNYIARGIGWVVAGLISSAGLILFIMYFLGHLSLYADTLGILKKLAYSESQDAKVKNYYGLSLLIRTNLSHWAHGVIYFLSYTFLLLSSCYIINRNQVSAKYQILLNGICKTVFIAIPILLLKENKINNDTLTLFFYGLNIVGGGIIILLDKRNPIKLLAFFGLYFLLSYPAGSSEGVLMAGVYCFWLITPLVFDLFTSSQFINSHLNISGLSFKLPSLAVSSKSQCVHIAVITGIVLLSYFNYFYPHSDKHNRTEMFSTIKSPYLKGIYTSQDRALVLNQLLDASEQFIKPGDAVLAYDCIALYHFLTKTRPFSRNPWPWLYQSEIFRKELLLGEQRETKLPIIVQQLKGTIGNEKDWPNAKNTSNYLNLEINRSRNEVLLEFINKHKYKQVWTNGFFQILQSEKQ